MSLQFDHTQYLTDVRMILGDTGSDIKQISPFTDREFYRVLVDPGFSGSTRFMAADLFFTGSVSSGSQSVTWKWQARALGSSSWTDLHTAVTETWGSLTTTGRRLNLDATALTSNADSVPLEVRVIATVSGADIVTIKIGGSSAVPAVRVQGACS